ncbi:MAG: hypothetical protein ACOX0J_11210 [Thermoactinomyces vulgaris]
MYHVLMKLMGDLSAYVLERVHKKTTPLDKLHAFIEASLAYQGTHHQKNVALIEIIFNGRTPIIFLIICLVTQKRILF